MEGAEALRCPWAPRPPLCLPAVSPDPVGHSETSGETSGAVAPGTLLATPSIVCRPHSSISGSSVADPPYQNISNPGIRNTPRSSMDQVNCLEVEWRSMTSEGLSPSVIGMIQASRRPSTNHLSEYIGASSLICQTRSVHVYRVVLRLDPSFILKMNSTFHHSQDLVLPNFCPDPVHRLEWWWHTLNV